MYLVYLINRKAFITVKTPFADSEPFIVSDLAKQGTCSGSVLNNCSLDNICVEEKSFNFGTVEVKASEFGDDVADPNGGKDQTVTSNDVICGILERRD